MKDTELKPCPECNSTNVYIVKDGYAEYYPYCGDCGKVLNQNYYDTEQKAVEAWNRRADK